MKDFLYINNVSFSYPDAIEPLFEDVSLQCQSGWCGFVGPNGGGKSTLLKLISGELRPDRGVIITPGRVLYTEQRMDEPSGNIRNFLFSFEKHVLRIKHQLHIQDDWFDRWDSLSFGERKRCQIGVALAAQPDVLLLDEPSNHLDHVSKNMLMEVLRQFKGIGLLVSHDRELLNGLCRQTVFVEPPQVTSYACAFSLAFDERQREQQALSHQRETVKRDLKKLQRRSQQQRQKADAADKQRSKRRIGRKDHDAKAKIDAARLTGKDAVQGRLYKRTHDRMVRVEEQLRSVKTKKQYALGIQYSHDGATHHFPITIAAGTLKMGEIVLHIPELSVHAGEKIALVGDNGAGKSTFIKHIVQELPLKPEEVIYIPQEISRDSTEQILHRISYMNDVEKGEFMSIIRRLGSEPARLLETAMPSPGEVRKLMLAEGLQKQPSLIIMDEPTNHMDLPSIQCVEQALVECGCATLLVSHDFIFLHTVASYFWIFKRDDKKSCIVPGFEPDI